MLSLLYIFTGVGLTGDPYSMVHIYSHFDPPVSVLIVTRRSDYVNVQSENIDFMVCECPGILVIPGIKLFQLVSVRVLENASMIL